MLGCAYELPARSRWRAGGGGGELSDALRHVQRSQHLFKDGALHVGAPQVRLLQVASGQVAVLHKPESLVGFLCLPTRCLDLERSSGLQPSNQDRVRTFSPKVSSPPGRSLLKWRPAGCSFSAWRSSAWPRAG